MKKTEKNLYVLYMVFATLLVTANVVASKIWNVGFAMFGAPATVTTGALFYPFISVVSDAINETWGSKEAKIAVRGGFLCQAISTLFIIIAGLVPATDGTMQDAYMAILGQNWVFIIASLTAYLISSYTDIFIFGLIRKKQNDSGVTGGKGRGLRAFVSTVIGQGVDTLVYVTIAFGLGFGWLWNGQAATMFNMILVQWAIKVVLATVGIPLFWKLTGNKH